MSGAKPAKKKQSLWQTLRAASSAYRRLYGYIKPYKKRFIAGLALGLAYGGELKVHQGFIGGVEGREEGIG